jgi:hypothetical protein
LSNRARVCPLSNLLHSSVQSLSKLGTGALENWSMEQV